MAATAMGIDAVTTVATAATDKTDRYKI
jgi:hypothetical protein